MSKEYQECAYNLWTGFVGKATCEAGYLKCDGLSCPLYTPKKEPKPQTNYDRLISKTPEELANALASVETGVNTYGDDVYYHWLSWLKATADKEET